jgi:hypothetical protein
MGPAAFRPRRAIIFTVISAMTPAAAISRRPLQFVLKELFALTLVSGLAAGIWQQSPYAQAVLLAAAIPLSGPALILWGSIFERRSMELAGAAMTLCVPVLLLIAALVPPLLGRIP